MEKEVIRKLKYYNFFKIATPLSIMNKIHYREYYNIDLIFRQVIAYIFQSYWKNPNR